MSIDSISAYIAISKNEQSAVDSFAKSDPATKKGVAALTKDAPTLTTPAALLGDQQALGVLLAGFNMTPQITQTAVLKALMTQSPTASSSLAITSNSGSFKSFATFMAPVSTVSVGLGTASSLALSTGGAAASTITVQNTTFNTPGTGSTAVPGHQWSFVLNDGTANATIQNTLAAAAGGNAQYTINTNGTVTGSTGAPTVVVEKGKDGSSIYSIGLVANSSGGAAKQLNVVSVPVTSGTSSQQTTNQVTALVTSMQGLGFGASWGADGSLAVTGNGIDASANPAGTTSTTAPAATGIAQAAAQPPAQVISFGEAGVGLQAGQVIMSGSSVVGMVQSVDDMGNVTLTEPISASVAKGAYLFAKPLTHVFVSGGATAATVSHVGTKLTAVGSASTSSSVLALGAAGASLQAGQTIRNAGAVVGTVASVDSKGNVTLAQPAQVSVAIGDTLTADVSTSATTTPALQNAGRVATAISQYQTQQYENSQDLTNPGMSKALYFTRNAGSITNVNQLMSDPNLLAVVTTNLGLPSAFGGLNFDQQVRILTKDVNFTKFQDPNYIKQSAEQYLAYQVANQPTQIPTGTLALFGGGADPGTAMLASITGQSLNSSAPAASNPLTALFA